MRIVLGTDGSKYARWAMGWVSRLPLAKAARVTAVHALDVTYLRAPFMHQYAVMGNEPYLREEIRRLEDVARRVVKDTKAMLASSILPGRVLCEKGSASAVLLRHAKAGDLLVMGSRGLDAMDRFLLGSVSTQALHHAPCSMLIVKEAPRPVRRIVVALDGSAASRKALHFLLKQCRPDARIELILVHVMPKLKYPEVKEVGKRLMGRDAKLLGAAGYGVTQAPRLGRPADEIMAVARQHQADLILCGAKGLGAVGRMLLGSVSTKLAQHSPCSVLVVR
jgi:nucleotide-binding universal stress UspA family protein